MAEKLNELKLYSPITADLVEEDPNMEYMDPAEYAQPLDGRELLFFRDIIEQAIEDEALPEEAERGLMAWYGEKDSLNEKVRSLRVTVEEKYGRLYGVAECEVRGGTDLRRAGRAEGVLHRPIRRRLGRRLRAAGAQV